VHRISASDFPSLFDYQGISWKEEERELLNEEGFQAGEMEGREGLESRGAQSSVAHRKTGRDTSLVIFTPFAIFLSFSVI
jgi:hypothetical protein